MIKNVWIFKNKYILCLKARLYFYVCNGKTYFLWGLCDKSRKFLIKTKDVAFRSRNILPRYTLVPICFKSWPNFRNHEKVTHWSVLDLEEIVNIWRFQHFLNSAFFYHKFLKHIKTRVFLGSLFPDMKDTSFVLI